MTIAGATYDTAESGVSLSATCTSGENLASATSNLFSVAAGVGVALRFVSQPTNTDVMTPLTVSLEIIDALGNRTTATIPVTLSLVDVAGCGGALSGTTTVNAVDGLASFTPAEDVVVRQICSGYLLRATAPGLGLFDSEPFNVSAGMNLAVARQCAGHDRLRAGQTGGVPRQRDRAPPRARHAALPVVGR